MCIAELEPLVDEAYDLAVIARTRNPIDRHGSGPYPAEDLAAFTDAELGMSDPQVSAVAGLTAPSEEEAVLLRGLFAGVSPERLCCGGEVSRRGRGVCIRRVRSSSWRGKSL